MSLESQDSASAVIRLTARFTASTIQRGLITVDPDKEPDTSDIPEVGEEWFKKAKLKMPRRCRCVECGVNWADYPSDLCPGCYAYKEHTG